MKRRGVKVTIGDVFSSGAAAPPRSSVSDKYARVFESKAEKQEREAVEQQSCLHCELIGEAHLHGATLYESGRALF